MSFTVFGVRNILDACEFFFLAKTLENDKFARINNTIQNGHLDFVVFSV